MRSFFKLWHFIRPQWKLLLGSVLLAIPLSAIRFSPAPIIKHMIDSILVKKDASMLLLIPLAIVGIYLLNVFVRFFQAYMSRLANERIMRDIRERLFLHYLSLSSTFFTDSSVGALISRVMNDVFYVSQGTIGMANLVREVITFLGLFGYALWLNPKLFVLTLVIAPMITWLAKRSGILMKNYSTKMQEANADVFSVLQEAFSGFKVVKAFSLEHFCFGRFKSRNDQYVDNALKAARVEEIGGPSVELMGAISAAIVLYVGGHDVISGRLSAGDLFAFFTSFGLMINPVRTFNDLNLKLNQAGAAADRIDEAFQIRSEVVESKHTEPLKIRSGNIEFLGLGFKYAKDLPWIFRGVSFSVPSGQLVAIVGGSGQGKSTLVSLLTRFHDAQEGKILIDTQDIKNITLQSLRNSVALVSQDVFLFNDSIYTNIAIGRPGATPNEVHAAAKAAFALPFIEKLPQGFDTIIGDRGQKLSGGERQRISIARAILKNAPILILDEATSSLDSESEKLVQQALDKLVQGRTTLVIAHRLSTVKHANKILVLSNGSLAESGTHDELISLKGEYAKFYQLLS